MKSDTFNSMVAYSYIRWSSPLQTKGDSFNRQLERTRQVCNERGWILDESIKPDKGLSAYKGDNLRKGYLGAFLAKVEQGEIQTPCILIAENWDRLTRQKLSLAQELLQDLLKKGVNIYTANTGKLYDRSCLDDPMHLFQFLLEAQSAHIYSENLSHRLKASWKRKKEAARKDGKLLTKKLPAWIKYDSKSKTFSVDESKADTVRTIFSMYLKGHGVDIIGRTLNQTDTPTFSSRSKESGWALSTIRRLLRSVSVIGCYQPQRYEGNKRFNDGPVIEDYYPAIIDTKTFYEAQTAIEERRGIKGPKRSVMTIFTGLVTCACCGSPVTLRAGTVTSSRKHPWLALVCRKAARGKGCVYTPFRYQPFEYAVITVLLGPILSKLYPTVENDATRDKLKAELEHVENQLANAKSDLDSLEKIPQAFWEFIADKEDKATSLRNRIESLPKTSQTIFPYQEIRQGNIKPLPNTTETRLKIRSVLPSLIDEIVLDAEERKAVIVFPFLNPTVAKEYDSRVTKKGIEAANKWLESLPEDKKRWTKTITWAKSLDVKGGGDLYFYEDGQPRSFEHDMLWEADIENDEAFHDALISMQRKRRRSPRYSGEKQKRKKR